MISERILLVDPGEDPVSESWRGSKKRIQLHCPAEDPRKLTVEMKNV